MAQPSTSIDAEAQLISRAAAGDVKSFGVLYDRYLNIVYNYVYYRLGTVKDTEIVTENIFLAVYENLHQFVKKEKSQHFSTWVLKLANTEIKRYLKKHPELKNRISDDILTKQQEIILNALRSLDELYYQFIVSRYFNGLSDKETARMIGVEMDAINLLQLNALQALEKQMKKDGQNG
ncbi:MAG: sigma-70 family RNA polymerase sigma factor [Anaerolineales bacterium]